MVSVTVPYAYWVTQNGPLENDNFVMPSASDPIMNQTYEPANITLTLSNGTLVTVNSTDSGSVHVPLDFELNETNSVSEQHMMFLNLTLNVDTTVETIDGRVEYYQIDLSSDKELIETTYFFIGTNSNSSFKFDNFVQNFHFKYDWFDTNTFNLKSGGGGGLFSYNWTAGFSRLWPEGGSGGGTLGGSGKARRVTALREAETLFITVYRSGWVTFAGNSTTVTFANNELIDQIQLQRYGEEGWIYNNLIPEDELAETDLLHPLSYEELYQVQPNNGE